MKLFDMCICLNIRKEAHLLQKKRDNLLLLIT